MNRKKVGQNLHTLRRQCKMTQAQIAKSIGVTTDHISHIEIGAGTVSLPLMLEICKLLNVTPNDILAGEYTPDSTEENTDFREEHTYCSEIALDKISPDDTVLLKHMYQFMLNRKDNK